MLSNAVIFITAQHGSPACDLEWDQHSLKPPKGAARGAGGSRHSICLGFQAILAAASVQLAQREAQTWLCWVNGWAPWSLRFLHQSYTNLSDSMVPLEQPHLSTHPTVLWAAGSPPQPAWDHPTSMGFASFPA